MKSAFQIAKNMIIDETFPIPVTLSPDEQKIYSDVQKNGYAVIPNFYSKSQCSDLRNEIDKSLETYSDIVEVDGSGADHRLFGGDRVSDKIRAYFEDPKISQIIKACEKTSQLKGCTLTARLDYKDSNLGSGQGWHKDSPSRKLTKAIIYLSNVSEANGPFQYLEKSHTIKELIKGTLKYRHTPYKYRFTQDEIDSLIETEGYKKITFDAPAGTLIIANTRGLHRGKPISEGQRYALTNYYFTRMNVPQHIGGYLDKLNAHITG